MPCSLCVGDPAPSAGWNSKGASVGGSSEVVTEVSAPPF